MRITSREQAVTGIPINKYYSKSEADAKFALTGASGWTDNGTYIFTTNTRNVGIGTTTPSQKLVVQDATADSTTYLAVTASGITNGTRNNVTGSFGYSFSVPTAIVITQLGRFYSTGNSANHTINVWDMTTGSAVATATVLAASPSDANGFKYVTLGTPVTLDPTKTYNITSDELNGGDVWKDVFDNTGYFNTQIKRLGLSYALAASTFPNNNSAGNSSYSLPTFKYTVPTVSQMQVGYDTTNKGILSSFSNGNFVFSLNKNDQSYGFLAPVAIGKGAAGTGLILDVAGAVKITSGYPGLTITDGTNDFNLGVSSGASSNSMRWSTSGSYMVLNSAGTLYLNLDSGANIYVGSNMSFPDGKNIVLGTSTGTQIGTGVSQKLSFFGATPIVKPTVTGSKGANAALTSLLTQLASLGLVVDSST